MFYGENRNFKKGHLENPFSLQKKPLGFTVLFYMGKLQKETMRMYRIHRDDNK